LRAPTPALNLPRAGAQSRPFFTPAKNRLSDFPTSCDYTLTTEMNPADDDHALLARYAAQHSEDAFRQLVSRHLDLVYSAALRQTRAAHLAEEVAQSVFIELSRSAARIRPDLPLTAWLYTVTRRKAIDLIRRESTRHAREQLAATDAALSPSPGSATPPSTASDDPAAWSRLTNILDDAMMTLAEKDRSAVLLRFFANRPLRDIGTQLGISEDAAQKRIARALDRLRENFSRRGFPIGATTLATALSAHAVHTAPLTLGPAISATALLAPPATLTGLATLLAMTTLQKTVIATALSLTLGCALYEAHLLSQQRTELSSLRSELALARNAQLEAERRQAKAEKELADSDTTLAKADDVLNSLANGPDAAFNAELRAWVQRVRDLKSWATRLPERTIPEMSLLTESDWLEASRKAKVSNEEEARQALSYVRQLAKSQFVERLQPALRKYKQANNGELPKDMLALAVYFEPAIAPAILARYQISGKPPKPSEKFIFEKSFVDEEYESTIEFQYGGGLVSQSVSKTQAQISAAIEAYRNAHKGALPKDPEALRSYFKSPPPPETLAKAKLAIETYDGLW
jgi:RNA polymerase sigma factor (sigma-70 family)